MRSFITGISSSGYGGQEFPGSGRSAACKLENQEYGGIIPSESEQLRTWVPMV